MPTLGQRIKAAQALAGFDSVEDLADKINEDGYRTSAKTLRRIANDNDHTRAAKEHELQWIAEATGVPLTFLTLQDPFAGSGDASVQLARLDDRIAKLEALGAKVDAGVQAAFIGRTDQGAEIIARLEKLLTQHARRLETATETALQALRADAPVPAPKPKRPAKSGNQPG